ncbi:MAG: adenylyltransferase/cytidyltransferase family protein [Sulfurimonadaceae bacterium]
MSTKVEDFIFDESELKKFRDECRKNSKKVVLATGVYDILHPGHLKFLVKSRECGDVLIVAINDDAFAGKKGNNRPIQNEYERAYLISGFECVSCVHIFDNSDHGKNLIRLVEPDVYIMSMTSQQKPEDRTEHYELIREFGGEVVVLDACSSTHSTNLIEQLNIVV